MWSITRKENEGESMKEGLIIKLVSGDYSVLSGDQVVICKARGVFRHRDVAPRVGDRVRFDEQNKYILEILPRKNELLRPTISNVDKVFLVFSVTEPTLNLNLLDRLLSIVEYNDIEPIIIFTKIDLLNNQKNQKEIDEYHKVKEYYQKIGYRVYEASKNNEVDSEIINEINGAISVLAGQSGVGKSTLLNKIEPSFNLKTAEISYALNRGKHTTRHVELLKVADGLIADTPGFGISDFEKMELTTFASTFVEFFKLSDECRFKTKCLHIHEPKCRVKAAVENGEILQSRYDNYLLFIEEIKELQRKY